jgi:S-formylglutathione hydrolase FrmB
VPLVILLHGVYGSHWGWALRGGAHRTAARMMECGEIPPMILAMPSDGLWGEGSGYVRHSGRDFERWIIDDVPATVAMVESCVDAKSPLWIAGLSMGGFGALRLAAKYPERIHGASGHSSATQLKTLEPFFSASFTSLDVRPEEPALLDLLVGQRSELPPFRFDCGTEDLLLPENRALHSGLEAAGVAHEYREFPGGHDWVYWEKHLEDSLRFFAGIR